MTFIVDYEHIFFDRYAVDKRKEAEFILSEVFKDKAEICENKIIVDDNCDINCIIKLLKHEFFILLIPCEEPVEEADSEKLAIDCIKSRFMDASLTVEEICDYCGTKRSVLDRQFVSLFGKTVTEYIKYCRVEEAEKLLQRGERVENVAALSGFGSVKTMRRALRSISGKNPSEYKTGCIDSKSVK